MAAPLLVALAACTDVQPAPTQVVVQTPPAPPVAQPPSMLLMSPAPPPPARAELVPPPPQGAGNVVWQPGHWRYTGAAGNPWDWKAGEYVPAPPGRTVWTPGQWIPRNGGWMWNEGHWA